MKTGPMILTGFSALNKLLGKEVYVSQDQLGGPSIMMPNGPWVCKVAEIVVIFYQNLS